MPKSLRLLFSPNNWWYVRLPSLASGWWHYTSPWWGMAFLQHPVPVYLLSSSAISEHSAHSAPLTMITEQARCTLCRPCGLLMMGENLIVNQTEAKAIWTAAGPSNEIWIHGIQISSTILFYVNEQTITLGMWSPWQHLTYGHFTWKWEIWSQLRCFKSSPSQDTVVIIVLCASLTPSTPERISAPLADGVTCLLWPLMTIDCLFGILFKQMFHIL